MAIPLVAGLAKALISQAPKIAAKQFSKKALKNAAKDFVKGKVKDKLKGKKKKKGGALVKTEGGLTTYAEMGDQPSKISPQKLLPQGVDVDANVQTVSSKGKVSYDKIQQQLDNIEGITSALNKAFQGELTAKKEASAKAKKAAQNARKKEREEKREGKTSSAAGLGSILPKGDPFNIFNFLKNILLGGALLFLVKQAPKIAQVFSTLSNNLYAFFLGAKYGLMGMKGAFKALGTGVKALGKGTIKLALAPFKLAGNGIKTAFKGLGTGIKNFVGMIGNRLLRMAGLKPPPGAPKPKGGETKVTTTGTGAGMGTAAQQRGQRATAGYRSPNRYRGPNQSLAGGTFQSQQARAKLKGPQPTVRPGSAAAKLRQFGASLQTGTAFGGRSAGLQRGVSKTAVKAQKAAQTTNSFLKKILGIDGAKDVARLKTASPTLKKASNFMKGARIPVVGPMIVFTLTALDPNPETGGVGRGAFKAIGAGLGEFLGFGIPIPILGPIIGGLVGEVMGDAAYEIIVNKDPAAAGKKIMDAFKAAAGLGGKVIDWAKGLVGRFFDAMPKLKLDFPKWIPDPLGIRGAEVIHPKMLTPLGLLELPGMFMKAFLNPEKKEEEKAEDSKIGEGSSQPNANLPSSPQTTPVTPVTITTAATISGGGSDFWTLAAVASREDSDGQARADVAQSIYNRKASGAYGSGSIRDLILQDGQYQPCYDYPSPNPAGNKTNPEWYNIVDARTAAAAVGEDVAFIEKAARDIQNTQYQEEAKKFVGARTDFTNYSKQDRREEVVRTTNKPNNYFGFDWNYQGNTMGGIPNFNTTTTTQQTNQQSNPAVTPSPLTGQIKTALLAYGTNEWSKTRSYIKEKTKSLIQSLRDKGYKVIVIPPSYGLQVKANPKGANITLHDPHLGVVAAAEEMNAQIEQGQYAENDRYGKYVHLHPRYAKEVKARLKPDIVVGDSNAALINGGQSVTAKHGADYAKVAAMISGISQVTPPSSPQQQQQQAHLAQKQRIQELQQKISQAEALLQNSAFAAGPLGSITKQNLAANKASLAKLTAQPQTPMMPPAPTQTTSATTPMQTSGSAITRAGQTTGTQKGDMISGYQVTSGYGQRWGRLHGGIDIGTPVGTFVGLSVPVEIMYAGLHGSTGSGYGNVVDAWAPSLGLQFRLAHLNTILCKKGQKLPAGTALGKTGGAQNDPGRGSSKGPHLHFEVDNVKNGTDYGGLGDPSPYVQYLILSANGPATGAVVTTPAAVAAARQNAAAVSQNPSYSASANNTVIIPAPQQQQPVMMGGGQGQGAIVMGGSTREVVNSYYKKQLLGFLYKQG